MFIFANKNIHEIQTISTKKTHYHKSDSDWCPKVQSKRLFD